MLLLRRMDGPIVSFALLLAGGVVSAGAVATRRPGAGRERTSDLLYEIVRVGIEQGYEQAGPGITTVQPRLAVGGVPSPCSPGSSIARALVQRAVRLPPTAGCSPKAASRATFQVPTREGERELVARRGLPT